jgi:hypothetical protein
VKGLSVNASTVLSRTAVTRRSYSVDHSMAKAGGDGMPAEILAADVLAGK